MVILPIIIKCRHQSQLLAGIGRDQVRFPDVYQILGSTCVVGTLAYARKMSVLPSTSRARTLLGVVWVSPR